MKNQRARCISCNNILTTSGSADCPRCGADNQAWLLWLGANPRARGQRFFLGSFWGWLALASLSLPALNWYLLGAEIVAIETFILATALYLNLFALVIVYTKRRQLWLDELTRQVSSHLSAGLLHLGGFGFAIFIIIEGLWLLSILAGAGRIETPPHWMIAAMLGLASVSQTLAAALYSVYAYGQWLLKRMPPPIFLDEAQLLGLVEKNVISRLQTDAEHTDEITAKLVDFTRARQAGLKALFCVRMNTDRVSQGCYLNALQRWQVDANKWGELQACVPDAPPEYAPAPNRPYIKATSQNSRPALEGEVIFTEESFSLQIDEIILTALTAASA